MNEQPLVTAIIATYNRGYIVCEAIDSILQQTYPNIEIVVVDDGSTDDTRVKLQRYGNRIRVIYQENSGPAAAWNTGVAASRGDIITFLGSDDLYLPSFVERQVQALEKAGGDAPCSISNCWLQFADGRRTSSFQNARMVAPVEEGKWLNPAEMLATRFIVFGQTSAIRRAAIERVGGFEHSLRYLEDYDLAFRLAMLGSWGFVREPLVVWRQSAADSLSVEATKNDDLKVLKISIDVRERILARLPSNSWDLHKLRHSLDWTIKYSRSELRARQLVEEGRRGKRLVGRFLLLYLRLRQHCFRESGRYPKMSAVNFGNASGVVGPAVLKREDVAAPVQGSLAEPSGR